MARVKKEEFDPRKFMQLAIEVMNKSIAETRKDRKISPLVGAVIVKPNGTVETAFRGELRHGDHAEFTLLERKNRSENLEGAILFTTLEPCAPGARNHPKLGCAERIVNARIKEVWIGIEDPDPNVDRKGMMFLQQNGIVVKMFEPEFQKQIKDANKDYLKQALQRSGEHKGINKDFLSSMEEPVLSANVDVFSKKAVELYLNKSKNNIIPFSKDFWNHFESIGMARNVRENGKTILKPTGFGLILFGEHPREYFPQAVLKARVKYGDDKPTPQDFDQPLVMVPFEVEGWLRKVLHSQISRDKFERQTITDFPIEPLREAIINGLAHRNYEQKGAKVYIEIDDDKIIVKSPGLPVEPISLKDIQQFKAPSLSKNPKITYVFNQMGLMEEFELGMETFRTMQEKHGLPLPQYSYNAPYLALTFPRSIKAIRKVSDNAALSALRDEELMGLEWIKLKGDVSNKEYAAHFNFTQRTASRHLGNMHKMGLLETNGEKINSPSLRYVYKESND